MFNISNNNDETNDMAGDYINMHGKMENGSTDTANSNIVVFTQRIANDEEIAQLRAENAEIKQEMANLKLAVADMRSLLVAQTAKIAKMAKLEVTCADASVDTRDLHSSAELDQFTRRMEVLRETVMDPRLDAILGAILDPQVGEKVEKIKALALPKPEWEFEAITYTPGFGNINPLMHLTPSPNEIGNETDSIEHQLNEAYAALIKRLDANEYFVSIIAIHDSRLKLNGIYSLNLEHYVWYITNMGSVYESEFAEAPYESVIRPRSSFKKWEDPKKNEPIKLDWSYGGKPLHDDAIIQLWTFSLQDACLYRDIERPYTERSLDRYSVINRIEVLKPDWAVAHLCAEPEWQPIKGILGGGRSKYPKFNPKIVLDPPNSEFIDEDLRSGAKVKRFLLSCR